MINGSIILNKLHHFFQLHRHLIQTLSLGSGLKYQSNRSQTEK